jgi:putative SOS response-associated peptidase YedK
LIPDDTAWADVGALLGEDILAALLSIRPRYNISPTQTVPIIVIGDEGKPILIEARWGFIPFFWKKPFPPTLTTNVRSETAAIKPMWKHAWRHSRCLIPASGWYEWFVLEDGSAKPPKVPHHIRREDGKHILFAGVWSIFKPTPESAGLPTCAVAM